MLFALSAARLRDIIDLEMESLASGDLIEQIQLVSHVVLVFNIH